MYYSDYSFRQLISSYSTTSTTEQQNLVASDGSTNDDFGGSISIYGNMIAVGAYGDNSYTGDNKYKYIYIYCMHINLYIS